MAHISKPLQYITFSNIGAQSGQKLEKSAMNNLSLFRNKRFMLDENASKFVILLQYESPLC